MENLMTCINLLGELTPVIQKLDYGAFGSFWAMLLEEWAKYNHQDAVAVADDIVGLIHTVNADLGPY